MEDYRLAGERSHLYGHKAAHQAGSLTQVPVGRADSMRRPAGITWLFLCCPDDCHHCWGLSSQQRWQRIRHGGRGTTERHLRRKGPHCTLDMTPAGPCLSVSWGGGHACLSTPNELSTIKPLTLTLGQPWCLPTGDTFSGDHPSN